MQQPRLPLWFLIANWALLVVAFAGGVALGNRRGIDLPSPQGRALELIHDEILRSHVEPQDSAVLLDRALAAMVDELDEYSRYVPPSEVASYVERSTGRYEGIGVLMVQHDEALVVHYPFVGSPAAAAGLLPGDRLVAVDGKPIAELPLQNRSAAASELVRGPGGTEVRLRIGRETAELDVTVARGPVQRSAVKWCQRIGEDAGLGYVHVSDFHRGVTADLRLAIARLDASAAGEPLRGLVLDLRNNGGGSLDECVAMARLFVRDGVIVSTRRRGHLLDEQKAIAAECQYPDLPLCVLVNGFSASASEVLAGALQDHGRAVVVGTRTYGKGYVNTEYTWGDLPFRLKLTTAHYFTPNGRNIDRPHRAHGQGPSADPAAGGIAPDIEAAVEKAVQEQIARGLAANEPPAPYVEGLRSVAARYGFAVPAPPRVADDPQLAQAVAALRERIAAGGKSR